MKCSNDNDIVQDLPPSIQIQRCIDLCRVSVSEWFVFARDTASRRGRNWQITPKHLAAQVLCDVYTLQPEEVYAETSGLKISDHFLVAHEILPGAWFVCDVCRCCDQRKWRCWCAGTPRWWWASWRRSLCMTATRRRTALSGGRCCLKGYPRGALGLMAML